MRKKRILMAGLVLAAALACLVPLWEELWLALAYENMGTVIEYYRKRANWLPGRRVLLPDQVCGACRQDLHCICHIGYALYDPEAVAAMSEETLTTWKARTDPYRPTVFSRCTCPFCHPKHE